MASVGDDNVLQIWQPNEAIFNRSKGDLLDLNNIYTVFNQQSIKGTKYKNTTVASK